jgi:hypothetical protein
MIMLGLRLYPFGTVWRLGPYVLLGAGPKWYGFGSQTTAEGLLVPENQVAFALQRAIGASVHVTNQVALQVQYAHYKNALEPALPDAVVHSRGDQVDRALSVGLTVGLGFLGRR